MQPPHRSLDRRSVLRLSAVGTLGVVWVPFLSCDSGTPGGTPATPTPSPSPAAPTGRYFPGASDQWEKVDPRAVGWDPQRLQGAIDYAGTKNSTGVVFLSGGRLMAEQYWKVGQHFAGDIASAQKSVLSVLIGIAQVEGLLKIEDTASKYLGAGWSKAPASHESRITLRHMLTMTSGLDDLFQPIAEPGAAWEYSNAYSALHRVVEKASGRSMNDYATEKLFAPLGMQDTAYVQRAGADPRVAGLAVKMSPRDMARFGLLVLNQGRWGDKTVLADTAYLAASLNTSQELNRSYGYLWWLNGKESHMLPKVKRVFPGTLVPSAPKDLVAALGKGDKKIYAVPSLDLVVARYGLDASGTEGDAPTAFDEEWWQRIMAARL